MRERCPLPDTITWDSDIPDKCLSCIDTATRALSVTRTDIFDPQCNHPVENGGESLQRIIGDPTVNRLYGTVLLCMKTEEEAFAEETVFFCPHDDPDQ